MNNKKTFFKAAFIPLILSSVIGCTTVKYYPNNFVESLKHPTKFPEVYSATVKNIEDVADKNPLGENEEIKITDVSENKNSSMYLVQIRENGELHPHYHKRHDELIYVKKGSGIATLDGSRYMIKPGSILQIPSRTVHKFLNTGGEPFVAVSIFSPPFDGRDEKMIREKKKADRGTKAEKRLVTTKPVKVAEKDKISNEENEPTEKEIQTIKNKSVKVAEKTVNKPVHEEWDTNTHNEEQSLPSKSSPSEGKKRSKEAVSPEEPTVNIKEMQEKLTKLLRLKEEGTISEEEYEGKKDAIVKGKDIGELPELKGPVKTKTLFEDDDEPILEKSEEQVASHENVTDEGRDVKERTLGLSHESKPTVPEDEPKEKGSSEDKLKTLDEMMQEGLITEDDYESKKKELIGSNEHKTVSMPSENTGKDEKVKELIGSNEEKTVSMPSENTSKDEKVKELQELYNEGLITEDDYESKKKELIGSNEEKTVSVPSENISKDERIRELKDMYNEGLITKDDYEYKLKELTGAQKQNSQNLSAKKDVQNEKLSELNELKEQGLISDEDYEFKKSQLLGK